MARHARHSTRLSRLNGHDAALDPAWAAGQRVMTIDGIAGQVLFTSAAFSPGITEYEVILDGGLGQGTYTASQLRPLPDGYRAAPGKVPPGLLPAGVTAGLEAEAEIRLASDDYPEMGAVLHDRPDPGSVITVVGMRRAAGYLDDEPEGRDDSWSDDEASVPWHDSPAMEPPGRDVHRGIALQLPGHVHQVVHDESRPPHERGFALARHLLTTPHPLPSRGQGLGYNWTDDPEVAKASAEREGGIGSTATPVVLHARLPDRQDMEDDRDLLRERYRTAPDPDAHHAGFEHDPWSFPDAETREVSMRSGSSVPITGVSWGPVGYHYTRDTTAGGYADARHDPRYTHLDFPEGLSARASATYGRPDDARDGEYNGGPNDTGVYWTEPGQQEWSEEHVGPQQEAPPPPWAVPPVLARLAQIEEACQLFGGTFHHATTINGTQVDDHGDAPEHGTQPRAIDPGSYDDRSTEGDGDPKWSDPVDPAHTKLYNGATVGMYPEGISAGGGPGLAIGPFTAALEPPVHGREMTPAMLAEHLHRDHGYSTDPSGMGALAISELASAHEEDHVNDLPEEGRKARWLSLTHDGRYPPHQFGEYFRDEVQPGEFPPGYDPAGDREQPPGSHHPVRDALWDAWNHRASRVPWTGHEREELHSWADVPTGTEGDFVPSGNFTGRHHTSVPAGEAEQEELRATGAARPTGTPGTPSRHDSVTNFLTGLVDLLGHGHDDPENSLEYGNDPDNENAGQPDDPGSPQASGPGLSGNVQAPSGNVRDWPLAGAAVTETGPAWTQGRNDGKRGQVIPPAAALGMVTAAAGSAAFRFELTAAWHDVVAKARRIRAEGHVRITHASVGMVIGEVRGDHDTYESGIQRPPGKPQTIQHWACGCPWASFHQDKSLGARYSGRPCSHVMALQYEAQARGMFGKSVAPDEQAPAWSPRDVTVKSWPPYEGDPHGGHWSEYWLAPAGGQAVAALASAGEDPGDIIALAELGGWGLLACASLRPATADQANAPWGSDSVAGHPPVKPYGATEAPDREQDPGSYGFLAAPDPENWGEIQDGSYLQSPLSNEAAHKVLVPGSPGPVPPHLNYPDVSGWHEDQESFGYTDRASAAGPSTSVTPRDPQGIRMEEARGTDDHGHQVELDPQDGWQHLDGSVSHEDGTSVTDGPVTAELRDEPEAALPSTTGDEPEATAGRNRPGSYESVRNRFRASGASMGDLGRESFPQSQQPSAVTQEPGMGSADEPLSPEDPSIQAVGNQQWSGGGTDSDEGDVPAGEPQGSLDDIIAGFQRSAAASQYGERSGGSPASGADIAGAAREFLSKTADVLPDAEAAELISEGRGKRARNLALLRLEGTHYEDEDGDLERRGLSLDDYDDDVISA